PPVPRPQSRGSRPRLPSGHRTAPAPPAARLGFAPRRGIGLELPGPDSRRLGEESIGAGEVHGQNCDQVGRAAGGGADPCARGMRKERARACGTAGELRASAASGDAGGAGAESAAGRAAAVSGLRWARPAALLVVVAIATGGCSTGRLVAETAKAMHERAAGSADPTRLGHEASPPAPDQPLTVMAVEEGIASWYGAGAHGNRTASGE